MTWNLRLRTMVWTPALPYRDYRHSQMNDIEPVYNCVPETQG
jgi:hypothetical protein